MSPREKIKTLRSRVPGWVKTLAKTLAGAMLYALADPGSHLFSAAAEPQHQLLEKITARQQRVEEQVKELREDYRADIREIKGDINTILLRIPTR